MRKKILITMAILLMFVINTIAQTYRIQAKPFDSSLWGYINLHGDLIIDAKYRKCFAFSESGYAPILDKRKGYYFISANGENLQTEIPKFKLKNVLGYGAKGFDEGLAPVFVNKAWGYLNTDGKLAIEAKYSKAMPFNEGYAIVKSGDTFYLLDKYGSEVAVQAIDVIEIKSFSEQLAIYKTFNGVYGFINTNGEVVIEAQYKSVGYFNVGVAWAKTFDGKIGYINKDGEWLIEPQFVAASNFDKESQLARIKKGETWAYLNLEGEIFYCNDCISNAEFNNGLAKAKAKVNEKFGFINSDMEWIIQPQYEGVRHFKNGYAPVKVGLKWGVIDKQGNWIIEPSFAALKDVEFIN